MTEILNRFPLFEKVDESVKKIIKLFHVFDDYYGYNVLFITSDDEVYGLGQNSFGCCGLGHNTVVNEPQVILELCHKSIKQFFIGYTFVLALNCDNKVFGWGRNQCGQLGRGYISEKSIHFKPEVIYHFKILNDLQLSCGSTHSLALTSDGLVYGWGDNSQGQCGFVKSVGNKISYPTHLKSLSKLVIKTIYFSYHQSFAITSDGFVYSWGNN